MGLYLEDTKLDSVLEDYFEESDMLMIKEENRIIDEEFLTFVNESAKVNDIKQFIKKMKKGEEITDAELKKYMNELLNDVKFKEDAGAQYNTLVLLFLSAMIMYSGTVIIAIAETEALLIGGIATTCFGYTGYFTSLILAMTNSSEYQRRLIKERLDGCYDKVMKIEAKAKVKLLKFEKLSDEKIEKKKDKIKILKMQISNADKLRNSYKSIVKKLENGPKSTKDRDGIYKEDFYYVNESGEVEMLQEIKGNDVKRELLKTVISDLDQCLHARLNYINDVDSGLKECVKTIHQIKNKEQAAKAIITLRKKARDFNYKNESNEWLESKALSDVKKQMNSFTNKYSFESVQALKTMSSKIDKYIEEMDKIVKKYDGETGSMNTEIYNAIDSLYLSDSFGENSARMIQQFESIILSWQKAMNTKAEATIKACDNIQKIIGKDKKHGGIKQERNLAYKLLNFKERKEQRKKENEN